MKDICHQFELARSLKTASVQDKCRSSIPVAWKTKLATFLFWGLGFMKWMSCTWLSGVRPSCGMRRAVWEEIIKCCPEQPKPRSHSRRPQSLYGAHGKVWAWACFSWGYTHVGWICWALTFWECLKGLEFPIIDGWVRLDLSTLFEVSFLSIEQVMPKFNDFGLRLGLMPISCFTLGSEAENLYFPFFVALNCASKNLWMVVLSPADPDIDFMIEWKPDRMCSSRVLALMLFAYLL